MEERVILVDENNVEIGTVLKSEVHGAETPLHRAFSCFVIDSNGRTWIQQRAGSKKTWPLVWSNSCCGHPLPGEDLKVAVQRRLKYEIGIEVGVDEIELVLPDFRYKAVFQGVMENEVCPVFMVFSDADTVVNPEEVEKTEKLDFWEWHDSIVDPGSDKYDHFSVWCREEIELLGKSEEFRGMFDRYCG